METEKDKIITTKRMGMEIQVTTEGGINLITVIDDTMRKAKEITQEMIEGEGIATINEKVKVPITKAGIKRLEEDVSSKGSVEILNRADSGTKETQDSKASFRRISCATKKRGAE